MNYEEMGDFEINQAVTCEVHGCHMWGVNKDGSFYHCGVLGDSYIHQPIVDYCNNPSDAWPIITSNSIAIFETAVAGGDVSWVATTNLDKSWLGYGAEGFDCYHNNPLRAAMIVFLMMREASK